MATIDKTRGQTVPDWAQVGRTVAVCQLTREGWRVQLVAVTKTTATQVIVDNGHYSRFNVKTRLEAMGWPRSDYGASAPFLADPTTPGVIDALRKQRKTAAAYKADNAAQAFAKERTMANATEATLAFRKWMLLEQEDQDAKEAAND